MKTILISLSALGLIMGGVHAEDVKKQSPELSDLVGRVFLTISKDYVVSGQDFDVPTLWANARLAHVEHPKGKGGGMGTGFETEYVPTDSGIVLRFYGPYSSDETQKKWNTEHDKGKRTFEILVELQGGKFIGVTGSYGALFPKHTAEDLISLTRILPENRGEKSSPAETEKRGR